MFGSNSRLVGFRANHFIYLFVVSFVYHPEGDIIVGVFYNPRVSAEGKQDRVEGGLLKFYFVVCFCFYEVKESWKKEREAGGRLSENGKLVQWKGGLVWLAGGVNGLD